MNEERLKKRVILATYVGFKLIVGLLVCVIVAVLVGLCVLYYELIVKRVFPLWTAPLPFIVGGVVYVWHRAYVWAKGGRHKSPPDVLRKDR